MKEAAEFYTNRVLKEGDDNQKAWAKAFPVVLGDIGNFVKKYHTTGLVWNPKGGEATASASSSSAPAPAAAAAAAAPKPAAAAAPAASSDAPKPDLFAALNKGGDIPSGLKKVEKSQMTHKNPELRATSMVPAAAAPKEREAPKDAASDKPAKFALEGNKWAIEYQKNNPSIAIDTAEAKHSIYIYKCTGSTIVVKGKVNQITLDSCKKVAVVCDSVISGVDIVNSNSCQIQVLGKAPTVSIDKTDGFQLYLSKDGLETEILTSKSSEMNILIPGKKEDDDMVETPIPEQFKTIFKNGKWHTALVEHTG